MRESRKPPFFNPGSCDRDVAGLFFLFNDDNDNDDEISEHGLLGFSRMIIHKNIKEPLIGGCSSSIMICVDIHM